MMAFRLLVNSWEELNVCTHGDLGGGVPACVDGWVLWAGWLATPVGCHPAGK